MSIRVSPLLTEDEEAAKFTMSAERRFSASYKDSLVRVEFSKNTFAMVISRRDGTFLIGLFRTSLKLAAVSRINWISLLFRSFIPNK